MGGRGSSSGRGAKGGGGATTPQGLIDGAQKNVTNLSELQGSQKQISWAESIRNTAFGQLNAIAENTMIAGRSIDRSKIFYEEITPDRIAKLNAINEVRESMKRTIGTEKRANTIIEDRNYMQYRDIDKTVTQVANAKKAGQTVKPEHIDLLVTRNMMPTVFKEKYRKK